MLAIVSWPVWRALKAPGREKNNSTHWCKSRAKTGVQEPHGMFSEHVWFTFLRANVFERL